MEQSLVRKAGQLLQAETNVGGAERVFSTLLGGGLLAAAIDRRDLASLPLTLLGGALAFRGLSGHCSCYQALGIHTDRQLHHPTGEHGKSFNHPVKLQKTVTINANAAKIYAFWRKLENLPRFMEHLIRVEEKEDGTSLWTARAPGGGTISWTARILDDVPNERLSWESLPGSEVSHQGSVSFLPGPSGRGCEVRVVLRYDNPAGQLGRLVAKVAGEEPGQQITADLRRLKQVLEAGEIPRTDGQPVGAGKASMEVKKA